MSTPQAILYAYFLESEPVYQRLADLKKKGWENPEGDVYYQKKRRNADQASKKVQRFFYYMMVNIGDELQTAVALVPDHAVTAREVRVLDLCMAPGGFSASFLRRHPAAFVCGISLPRVQGGHDMLLSRRDFGDRFTVSFLDITMLAAEFGVSDVPANHPDSPEFLQCRPFEGQTFDIVFCDGQVLRTQKRESAKKQAEATRLSCSQLVLGFQRIVEGGTMVVLLHKVDGWRTVQMLYSFGKFSSVQLFKPQRSHRERNSFYLVAKNIKPRHPEAELSIERWRRAWWDATFEDAAVDDTPGLDVAEVIENFGPTLIELARPIWQIQADALADASYTRSATEP
ncbi:MAG: hypothetical protein M1825_001812 [Sarcosagium campestre]|nr:MAG: hypothetical protein M1825_001812 [Sarcosagium campestre]